MRISKYISDLLFEYECVVIPGFGGFISNEIPAGIDANQHNFNPPSKKIVFNASLRVNDGLLVNHIATSEGISYSDARLRVESFVRKCSTALEYGKRIHFQKIGWIEKSYEGNLEFDPDHSQNYNGNAFGLAAFISPPVKREQNIRINKKFRDRKPAPAVKEKRRSTSNKEPRYISINLMTVIILAIVTTLFVMNYSNFKDLYKQYGTSVPFFYPSAGEFFIYNIDNFFTNGLEAGQQKPDEDVAVTETSTNKILREKSSSIAENDVTLQPEKPSGLPASGVSEVSAKTPEKQAVIETSPAIKEKSPAGQVQKETTIRYHIIAGSFENHENARQLVDQLRSKGFGASIIGQNKYGMFRVSFEGFARKEDAEKQLAVIRENENQSAWIHKI